MADESAAAGREDFHAAILDVNVEGQLIYPLADMIAARGVPFVFVTGYGVESIERRFAQVPVLQKPIERPLLQNIFVLDEQGELGCADKRRAVS